MSLCPAAASVRDTGRGPPRTTRPSLEATASRWRRLLVPFVDVGDRLPAAAIARGRGDPLDLDGRPRQTSRRAGTDDVNALLL